jgi:hypothetical protein
MLRFQYVQFCITYLSYETNEVIEYNIENIFENIDKYHQLEVRTQVSRFLKMQVSNNINNKFFLYV